MHWDASPASTDSSTCCSRPCCAAGRRLVRRVPGRARQPAGAAPAGPAARARRCRAAGQPGADARPAGRGGDCRPHAGAHGAAHRPPVPVLRGAALRRGRALGHPGSSVRRRRRVVGAAGLGAARAGGGLAPPLCVRPQRARESAPGTGRRCSHCWAAAHAMPLLPPLLHVTRGLRAIPDARPAVLTSGLPQWYLVPEVPSPEVGQVWMYRASPQAFPAGWRFFRVAADEPLRGVSIVRHAHRWWLLGSAPAPGRGLGACQLLAAAGGPVCRLQQSCEAGAAAAYHLTSHSRLPFLTPHRCLPPAVPSPVCRRRSGLGAAPATVAVAAGAVGAAPGRRRGR